MKVNEFTTAITEQFTSLGKETTNMTIFGTSVWGDQIQWVRLPR